MSYDLGLPHCYSSFFFPVEGYIILSHYIATKSLDQPLSTIIDHYQPLLPSGKVT